MGSPNFQSTPATMTATSPTAIPEVDHHSPPIPDSPPLFDPIEAALTATQASTTIEPDEGFFSDDNSSSADINAFTTISTYVRDYNFENGRRYHKFREGRYVFPNDENEQDREDMKHAMIVNLCGGQLHFAPIGEHPQRILDIGTGTGIWCIDMGDEYPSASILGIDLSPIQPLWVPPNVRFRVDDAESPWLDKENLYDLVHARHITSAIKDFPKLIKTAYRHIKPGGWIEFQELHHIPHCDDDTMTPSYPLRQYYTTVMSGLQNLGVHLDASRAEILNLSSYGFINVHHEILKIPIGTWPKNKTLKTAGLYAKVGISDGLQAMAYGPLCRGMGWSKEQVEVMLVGVRKCLNEGGVHAYLPFHIVYGQKPLEGMNDYG